MKNYFIKDGYVSRLDNKYFNDTRNTDKWQKEVYIYAKKLFNENKFSKVLDIGTGSAYKLITNFAKNETLGLDVTRTVEWLRETYPEKQWSDKFEPIQGYDMIIASDVIEHIVDPNTLLDLIEQCNPKLIVFSTPDRDLLAKGDPNGPPKNRAHVREWTMPEFHNYINSRFTVIDQFISNSKQATQVILAKMK
jgi:Methyltransferase domain